MTTKCEYLCSVESGNSALSANLRFTKVGKFLDIIQERQYASTYNVTLRRVCRTNFEAEEQQLLHILSVCVCVCVRV